MEPATHTIIIALIAAIAAAGATFFILKHQAAPSDAAGATTITETEMATIKQRRTTTEGGSGCAGHALAHERALCEAEMKIIRHALQSVRSNYAMVDMLELDPNRTPEIIAKVKARRKEQEATEAAEKAQLVIAKITATAP